MLVGLGTHHHHSQPGPFKLFLLDGGARGFGKWRHSKIVRSLFVRFLCPGSSVFSHLPLAAEVNQMLRNEQVGKQFVVLSNLGAEVWLVRQGSFFKSRPPRTQDPKFSEGTKGTGTGTGTGTYSVGRTSHQMM